MSWGYWMSSMISFCKPVLESWTGIGTHAILGNFWKDGPSILTKSRLQWLGWEPWAPKAASFWTSAWCNPSRTAWWWWQLSWCGAVPFSGLCLALWLKTLGWVGYWASKQVCLHKNSMSLKNPQPPMASKFSRAKHPMTTNLGSQMLNSSCRHLILCPTLQ